MVTGISFQCRSFQTFELEAEACNFQGCMARDKGHVVVAHPQTNHSCIEAAHSMVDMMQAFLH